LRQIFPIPGVSIAYRSPVNWAGDLSQGAEWTRLLSFINELKKADSAATSTLYYGVIPTRNNAGTTYARTWGGYGYIGQRASVGVQGNVSTFAHEAGHNLSLQHGPCGGPSGPDLSYPYPDGRIGQFGVSAATLAGYNPVVVRDFMTYCYPEWISDYFYQKLYNNQRSVGGLSAQTTAVADVFVVRAFAGPEGIAIQPVYRLEQAQVSAGGVLPPPSGYWVDVLDAAGRVLASARLDAVPLASEDLGGEGYIQELTAHVPYVDGVVRLVIRSESASPLAERRVYDVPDSASQAVELRIDGQTQTLTWPAAAGWLRVSIRQAPDQPWQLYALDWPASLPLSLPPGAWQVHWVLADQPAAGHLLAP
jgi:hypothetical protein